LNLVDLVDDKGLQQDEWSLTKPVFGKEGQLQVVGWSGRQGSIKRYVVKCTLCSNDSELFGGGYFLSVKGSLNGGWLPCGCSGRVNWTKAQYEVKCQRAAEERGFKFVGFHGPWLRKSTKIHMVCEKHGMWSTGSIDPLISKGSGCPSCQAETIKELKSKPDDIMIQSFFASGAFHPETRFWRSDRKSSYGWKVFWYIFCPECGEQAESASNNLQQGKRSCACTKHRQREAYINRIISDGVVIALKFGIANSSVTRVRQQNYKSVYEVTPYLTYNFSSVEACKAAERECKSVLDCGAIPRQEMLDGYTETTHVYNLDKIKQIYKKHGGIEVCHSP